MRFKGNRLAVPKASAVLFAAAFATIMLALSVPDSVRAQSPGSVSSDRAALVAFYNATDGANWRRNNNWLSDKSLNQWEGVETGSNGRVTALHLDSNDLKGTLPAEMGSLSKLHNLGLGYNNLEGAIPPELGNLSNMLYLKLNHNSLTGAIPSELGNLSKLYQLDLGYNNLEGAIPPELGNLSKLNDLRVDQNKLTGAIPPELGKLSRVTWLILARNQLSGVIPPELGNMSKLNVLGLGTNQLSGAIPTGLRNLSNLVVLEVNRTSVCAPSDAAFHTWLRSRRTVHPWNIPACPPPTIQLLTAQFFGVYQHHGRDFDLKVEFSEPIDPDSITEDSFTVSGGRVKHILPSQSVVNDYLLVITPDGEDDVQVVLEEDRPCGGGGAICTPAGLRLSNQIVRDVSRVSGVFPTACAGPDLSGVPGATVTLQGKCSTNPYGKWYRMAHRWTQESGTEVTLTHPRTFQPASHFGDPSFVIPAGASAGDTFVFRLTVTDQEGESDSDEVTVSVDAPQSAPTVLPTACAGEDLSGAPGATVTLQGKCSTNHYGPWWRLAHQWKQQSGTEVTLTHPQAARHRQRPDKFGDPSFVIPASASSGDTFVFRLTVTDSQGQSDSDDVTVTVQ